MCLTTQALVLFLNLLDHDAIRQEPGRVVIGLPPKEAHWVEMAEGDRWCTMAPQIDRIDRFSATN